MWKASVNFHVLSHQTVSVHSESLMNFLVSRFMICKNKSAIGILKRRGITTCNPCFHQTMFSPNIFFRNDYFYPTTKKFHYFSLTLWWKKTRTVDGRNPAPVNTQKIPFFIGFYTSPVVIAGFVPSTLRISSGEHRIFASECRCDCQLLLCLLDTSELCSCSAINVEVPFAAAGEGGRVRYPP